MLSNPGETYCSGKVSELLAARGRGLKEPVVVGQEGEMRPQLLDRFGMSVNVATMQNIAARTRMVLDRIAFEKVRHDCSQTC